MSLFGGKPFGLYITDDHIQVMQLKGKNSHAKVEKVGELAISKGIVVNGELRQEKELAEQILTLLEQTKPKKMTQKKCVVALPESQSYESVFYLPANLEEEELKKAIDKEVNDNIPMPFNEIKYDYLTYPMKDKQIVFVVAVPRIIIAQFYEVIKEFCGLKPMLFEPESISLIRNLPVKFDADKGTVLIYHKGNSITWFSFWGEIIFDSNSISMMNTENALDVLLGDIERSMNFYKENTGQEVGNIILAGTPKELDVINKKLSLKIKTPITKLSDYKVMGVGNPHKFAVTSGAALHGIGMQTSMPIDLLKKEEQK